MKVIYMCHPVGAETAEGIQANLDKAKRWYKWIQDTYDDIAVSAGWLVECEIYDDAVPEEREAGLLRDEELVTRVDEVWFVGGRVSNGMSREGLAGMKAGLPVFDLTSFGIEPPLVKIPITEKWSDPKII